MKKINENIVCTKEMEDYIINKYGYMVFSSKIAHEFVSEKQKTLFELKIDNLFKKYFYKINFVKNNKLKHIYEFNIFNKYIILNPFLVSEKTFNVKFPVETIMYVTFEEYVKEYKSNFYLVPTNFTHGMNFNGRLILLKDACKEYDLILKYKP